MTESPEQGETDARRDPAGRYEPGSPQGPDSHLSDSHRESPKTAGPDVAGPSGQTTPAMVEESDPNADSRQGLAGDMGVSSGWTGPARGVDEEVTYGSAATFSHPEGAEPDADPLPEQSAQDGPETIEKSDTLPEANPASTPPHRFDPSRNPGHGS